MKIVLLFYHLFLVINERTVMAQRSFDQLAVARCRSQCITSVTSADKLGLNDALCKQSMNCYICWDHCSNLGQDWDKWSALCRNEVDFCRQHAGCGHACRIMNGMVPIARQVTPLHRLPPPQMNYRQRSKEVRLNWTFPKISRQERDVPVSWIFFREQTGPWRTLMQTLNNSLVFNVIRKPQHYSFCITLIDRNGPRAQTPVVRLMPNLSVQVLQDDFAIDGNFKPPQSNEEESLEAEWRRLIGGVNLLSKRLESLTQLSNGTSLPTQSEGPQTHTIDALPLILGIASSVVGLLIVSLVAVTCYFHRNQSQQLEDMRSSFHAWSSRLGSSFRSSVQLARHSLRRRSARSASTVIGSTDSGVVLTSGQIYTKPIPEV